VPRKFFDHAEAENMDVRIESRDTMLWVTITGQVSLAGAVENAKKFCDTSADLGLNRILVDCSKLKGELSTLDRYELGRTAAEYAVSKRIAPVLAFVGHPPTIDGFAARVASNRGLVASVFSERQAALDWLNQGGSPGKEARPMAPGKKTETLSPPETIETAPTPIHDQIEALAYALWQERGCPEGSPEVDWFMAEDQVTTNEK
jgi:hypothetical protein